MTEPENLTLEVLRQIRDELINKTSNTVKYPTPLPINDHQDLFPSFSNFENGF